MFYSSARLNCSARTNIFEVLPTNVLAQQVSIGNHAHGAILIIRDWKTTHVPAKHQISRFLEGRFRLYRNWIEDRGLLHGKGTRAEPQHPLPTNAKDGRIRRISRSESMPINFPSLSTTGKWRK